MRLPVSQAKPQVIRHVIECCIEVLLENAWNKGIGNM
jgi:hypothetical protein